MVDPHKMAQLWKKVKNNVAKYGWHITGVFHGEDTPPFAYSVGAWDLALPELLIVGLGYQSGGAILNEILGAARDGLELKEGVAYNQFANFPLYFKALTPNQAHEWTTMACTYHTKGKGKAGSTVPFLVLQVVYPDPKGRYPWDKGYDFPPQTRCWEDPL